MYRPIGGTIGSQGVNTNIHSIFRQDLLLGQGYLILVHIPGDLIQACFIQVVRELY